MKYWTEYKGHDVEILGRTKKVDNTIYTFDIETTSYLVLGNRVISARDYQTLSDEEQEDCKKQACMYVWQFSVNDQVYYGRTWVELKLFLDALEKNDNSKKIVFIHNLSFEFQALWSVLRIKSVMSRKSRKLMTAQLEDYDIELRCTMMMSNAKLEKLPDLYQLPVRKKVGDLDYNKIRVPHIEDPKNGLTDTELAYCYNDVKGLSEAIRDRLEKDRYNIATIPLTSTGYVRKDTQRSMNANTKNRGRFQDTKLTPNLYRLCRAAFRGGNTHANA